ncbi:copper homeostasis membrane protein CopD (plasmid) [Rhizobium grahamii]|uniref:Copper homeostasis membrane protein CopD n=1 Tax=Rhizobium grahamii TaxID=1120045 RepID=A0A5Q0CAY6_9HYPH|nr:MULTISPECIES: copper homeostasis membrane protein CopD [Rhizobium]QFY62612.1 copper homeostasis membrane protein CopD [Rhizobium grahamii]QRM52647.1 copper homeostasis membrane protein CopD [Rhizobium sp. BG6]
MTPQFSLIVSRFLFDSAALGLWGASIYLSTCVHYDLASYIDLRLRRWRIAAVAILCCVSMAFLPLQAATMGDGWIDAVSASVLNAVLFSTNNGTAWFAQVALVLSLALSWLLQPRKRLYAQTLCAGLLLATLSITGHAAMNDANLRTLHRLNDVVHLLCGGAWLGALVPVILLLRLLGDAKWQDKSRRALMRFSTVGHLAVAAVVLSGVANTLLVLGGLPTDWSQPYQLLLCVKIIIVGTMIVLALVNRYVLVPRLASNSALELLRGLTWFEIVLGLSVVGLVAVFGTLAPTA